MELKKKMVRLLLIFGIFKFCFHITKLTKTVRFLVKITNLLFYKHLTKTNKVWLRTLRNIENVRVFLGQPSYMRTIKIYFMFFYL